MPGVSSRARSAPNTPKQVANRGGSSPFLSLSLLCQYVLTQQTERFVLTICCYWSQTDRKISSFAVNKPQFAPNLSSHGVSGIIEETAALGPVSGWSKADNLFIDFHVTGGGVRWLEDGCDVEIATQSSLKHAHMSVWALNGQIGTKRDKSETKFTETWNKKISGFVSFCANLAKFRSKSVHPAQHVAQQGC